MVRHIVANSPGPDVLDVGCGTGIASRQFRAAGCRVLGVDADARMADLARQTGIDVEVATFEGWDPAGRTFDAVVAGQAWHWVDPVAGAAKAAEVLRPGGLLAVFWNAQQPPSDLTEAVNAIYRRVLTDSPFNFETPPADPYGVMSAMAADGMRQVGGFGEPDTSGFDWEHTYTRDDWLDVLPTQGAFTQLAPAELAAVLAGVGAEIDAVGGSFRMRYTTVTVTAVRAS
jgi:SAM-dependent methyltransferase